jgi:hypothetical protein
MFFAQIDANCLPNVHLAVDSGCKKFFGNMSNLLNRRLMIAKSLAKVRR